MMENSTIKKMVSGILSGRKNASFDRHIMHPEREWFVVVFIGFVLFAFGISWNVSTHLQFKNVSITNPAEVPETIVYRAGLVESALADFEVRKKQYEELKQTLIGRQISVPIVSPTSVPVVEGSTEEGEILIESEATTTVPEVPVEESAAQDSNDFDPNFIRFE